VVTAQVLERQTDGSLVPLGGPTLKPTVRSGQVLRLLVQPVQGPAQPAGADCPVRVRLDGLVFVARPANPSGFVIDGQNAYGLLKPGEERALDFELKPFEDWDPAYDEIDIDKLTVSLPQTAEFASRLPAPIRPPLGTVCADVVYPDAEPATGVVLNLSFLTDSTINTRMADEDGRACWEGFDEFVFGHVSLDPQFDAALGQPKTQFVSRDTSYRLFVVQGPR